MEKWVQRESSGFYYTVLLEKYSVKQIDDKWTVVDLDGNEAVPVSKHDSIKLEAFQEVLEKVRKSPEFKIVSHFREGRIEGSSDIPPLIYDRITAPSEEIFGLREVTIYPSFWRYNYDQRTKFRTNIEILTNSIRTSGLYFEHFDEGKISKTEEKTLKRVYSDLIDLMLGI